jgi:alpha-beta hydrolase superfamily lysophospholipase
VKRFFRNSLTAIAATYILLCALLYFVQEKLLFFPQRLARDHTFQFDQPFQERNIETLDGTVLSGIYFKADSSKGLIFFLHGNAGSLDSWGRVAGIYIALGYDVFMLDYRGFGKSDGAIDGQEQFYRDVQTAYVELKKDYPEDRIIVLGHSIGTGPASRVASENKPRLLILHAPYYSMTDMMRRTYSIFPTFLLKYKFETFRHLKMCAMPVVIFHGDVDEVIYYGSSLKLEKEFKATDRLITLAGQGHDRITENKEYRSELARLLNE